MTDVPLLRIGPFSRASSLSVKALRGYHEAGLLVPAEVDLNTGYRSYSTGQLADAAVIRRLRQIDLPLEAIRQILDARDPEVTRKVLDEHGAALEAQLDATRRAIDELQLGTVAPPASRPDIRYEPATTVLAISAVCSESDLGAFVLRAAGLLLDVVMTSGAVVDGPFGACFPTLVEDDEQAVTAFVAVTAAPLVPQPHRSEGVVVDELPGTLAAVTVHHGSYEGLADAYGRLGAWVGANARPAELPVRERYLVTAADVDDFDDLRTEISWPILAGPHTPTPEEHP